MLRNFLVPALGLLSVVTLPPPGVAGQDLSVPARVVPELRRPGVQPGDRITLTIYNQRGEKLTDIGGQRTVDSRGLIYLPFLEEVQVQGMDPDEVRDMLDQRYEQFYTNSVVEAIVDLRVNVTGSVRSPGSYFLSPTATLSDALSAAGGTGGEIDLGLQGGAADPTQVRLVRRGYERPLILNFRPLESNQEVLNARIQSGDWLFVPPATRSRVREDILFIGNILTVLIGAASLIILATGN